MSAQEQGAPATPIEETAGRRAEARPEPLDEELEEHIQARTAALHLANARLEKQQALIAAIQTAQTEFSVQAESRQVFAQTLQSVLDLTGSEYGFIDELYYTDTGRPYLVARAITDISWNEETRLLYQQFVAGTLTFDNLRSLYGEVITTRQPVIANDAPRDPRRTGVPPGHPALNAFLGLPLYASGEMVGVMGLANRPGGYSDELVAFLAPVVASCGNLVGAWKAERLRRQAEEELRRLNSDLERRTIELEAANQELEAFSYSVSHDLRAPLRGICGWSGILLSDYGERLDPAGRESLELVCAEARRMETLIDDLLQLAHTARTDLVPEPVDLTAIARDVCDELARHDPARRAEVAIASGLQAVADPVLARLVLQNLLDNAFKFTSACSNPRIEVDRSGQAFFVRDNGAGFDMAFAGKLFKPFQRLHRQSEFPGSGIGLVTVKRILQRHGGRVWAEAGVGRGATFYFTFAGGPPAGPSAAQP